MRKKQIKLSRFLVGSLLFSLFCFGGQIFAQNKKVQQKNKESLNLSDWVEFRDNDGGFVISAPIPFSEQKNANFKQFIALAPTDIFQVMYSPKPTVSTDSPNANELTDSTIELMEKRMADNGSQIISRYRDSKNSYFWQYWNSTPQIGKFMHLYSRSIIKDGVLFELQCGSRVFNQKANQKACQKFLNSFRFAD